MNTLKLWIKSKSDNKLFYYIDKLTDPKILISIITFLGCWILVNILVIILN